MSGLLYESVYPKDHPQAGKKRGLFPVVFLTNWQGYNGGEIAGFPYRQALALCTPTGNGVLVATPYDAKDAKDAAKKEARKKAAVAKKQAALDRAAEAAFSGGGSSGPIPRGQEEEDDDKGEGEGEDK